MKSVAESMWKQLKLKEEEAEEDLKISPIDLHVKKKLDTEAVEELQ